MNWIEPGFYPGQPLLFLQIKSGIPGFQKPFFIREFIGNIAVFFTDISKEP